MDIDYPLRLCVAKHIQRFLNESSNSKTHYVIEVTSKDVNQTEKSWTVERVWEDFEQMNNEIKKRLSVPKFPTKGLFSSKTPEELSRRKDKLEVYLVECASRMSVKNDLSFMRFIELLSQSDLEILKTTLLDKYQFKQTSLEFSSIIILENNLFYIAVNNNAFFARQKVFPSNFSILEKVNEDTPVASQLAGFSLIDNSVKRLSSVDLTFEAPITAFLYCDNHVLVGLKTGKLYYVKLDIEEEKLGTEFSEIKVFKTSEIIGIGMHEDYLFVMSNKKLSVFSMSTKVAISGMILYYILFIKERVVQFEITCLHFIKEKCAFIIGNTAGHIIYVSLITNTFRIRAKVSCCLKNSRVNALYLGANNKVYTCSKEGYISIIEMTDDGDLINLSAKRVFRTKYNVS